MASNKGPVGEMKKIVSLVDRVAFDEFVYPSDAPTTKFQPTQKPYHNFSQETVVWPFSGRPDWGQTLNFKVPWPWQGDFLNYIALRLKPLSWLTLTAYQNIGPETKNWQPIDQANFFIWANSLGTIAIEKAELVVDGVTIEQFSGDWINVWNKTAHGVSTAAPYDEIYNSYAPQTKSTSNISISDDGYVYCYLPFWFAKYANTAFPLLSKASQDTIQFNITLRPFSQVIRKLVNPLNCKETPCGTSFLYRNLITNQLATQQISLAIPSFEAADIVCGITHIDGELRKAYIEAPHELMMEPVVETQFYEPQKYTVSADFQNGVGNRIKIGLPLTIANGPIKQIFFFLRRKASIDQFNDYNNYSAQLENEVNPIWNPSSSMLVHAQLMIGTAVWADEDEPWWRASPDINLPGGIRAYGNYIYGYNFANKPAEFSPSGTVNASRVDMRLNLTVNPPDGTQDTEWTVSVFVVAHNWMRFENGLANQIFMD